MDHGSIDQWIAIFGGENAAAHHIRYSSFQKATHLAWGKKHLAWQQLYVTDLFTILQLNVTNLFRRGELVLLNLLNDNETKIQI